MSRLNRTKVPASILAKHSSIWWTTLYHFRSGTERHFDTQPGKAGFPTRRNANAFQTKAADGNRTHISSLGRRPQALCASPKTTRKLDKLGVWRHFNHCNEVQSRAFVCDHVYPEVGRSGYRLCRAPTLSDCTIPHPETRFNQQLLLAIRQSYRLPAATERRWRDRQRRSPGVVADLTFTPIAWCGSAC